MTWELAANAVDIERKTVAHSSAGTFHENMMSSLGGKSTFAITQRALPKIAEPRKPAQDFCEFIFLFTFTALVDGFIFKMRNKNNFGTAHF